MTDDKKIRLFLKGELPKEELDQMVETLRTDRELAEKVEFERIIIEMDMRVDEHELREKLRSVNLEAPHVKTFSRWAIAATILIIVGLTSFLKLYDHTDTIIARDQERFPPQFTQSIRGATSSDLEFSSDVVVILENRDQHNVDQAIQYFSAFNSIDTLLYPQALFNLAQAYQLSGDYSAATAVYKDLLDETNLNQEIKDQAEYYSALNYILDGRKDSGALELSNISSNPKHLYQNRASQIMSEISSFWARLTSW